MTTKVLRTATIKTKKSSNKSPSGSKANKRSSSLPVCQLVIEAHEQPRISLGTFTADHPPKGFSIHINPDPEPDTIVTKVTKLGTEWRYELVLHIANYSDHAVDAEVWPLS